MKLSREDGAEGIWDIADDEFLVRFLSWAKIHPSGRAPELRLAQFVTADDGAASTAPRAELRRFCTRHRPAIVQAIGDRTL